MGETFARLCSVRKRCPRFTGLRSVRFGSAILPKSSVCFGEARFGSAKRSVRLCFSMFGKKFGSMSKNKVRSIFGLLSLSVQDSRLALSVAFRAEVGRVGPSV